MTFHDPSIWFLGLLPLAILVWWNWRSPRRRPAVVFSSIEPLRRAGRTWGADIRWIVPVLRTLTVILLIVCMARPQQTDQEIRQFSEGIAIQLVVDRSGSMRAEDFTVDGRRANRLEAVKRVVENFIAGGEDLPGREHDLVGLIAFATYPDSICPLTLDHDHAVDTIRTVEPASRNQETGTAIGEAIALGVERLHSLDRRRADVDRGKIQSKVMILLTDGENNSGEIEPIIAAELAAAYDIRIYTIGAGTENAVAPIPMRDGRGNIVTRSLPVSIDEDTLRKIADISGGRYFRATDTDSLAEIYARIDELEKTDVEERRYVHYSELAVQPVPLGPITLPPLLLVVFLMLGVETLLAQTKFAAAP